MNLIINYHSFKFRRRRRWHFFAKLLHWIIFVRIDNFKVDGFVSDVQIIKRRAHFNVLQSSYLSCLLWLFVVERASEKKESAQCHKLNSWFVDEFVRQMNAIVVWNSNEAFKSHWWNGKRVKMECRYAIHWHSNSRYTTILIKWAPMMYLFRL